MEVMVHEDSTRSLHGRGVASEAMPGRSGRALPFPVNENFDECVH